VSKAIDITGQRFGRLVAQEPTVRREGTNVVWVFGCDCGEFIERAIGHVRAGRITSCGCARRAAAREPFANRKSRLHATERGRVLVEFIIPREAIAQLDAAAARRKVTRASYVRDALLVSLASEPAAATTEVAP